MVEHNLALSAFALAKYLKHLTTYEEHSITTSTISTPSLYRSDSTNSPNERHYKILFGCFLFDLAAGLYGLSVSIVDCV